MLQRNLKCNQVPYSIQAIVGTTEVQLKHQLSINQLSGNYHTLSIVSSSLLQLSLNRFKYLEVPLLTERALMYFAGRSMLKCSCSKRKE